MTTGTSGNPSSGTATSPRPSQPRRSRTSILLIGFTCSLVIFISLALIYYDQPSMMVQTIGILIVLLSLVLVLSGGWREVGALMLLMVFISTASIIIVTRDMNQVLAIGTPLLWLIGLASVIGLLYRSTLKIGPDEFVLIRNEVNGQIRMLKESVELPPLAGWEEVVARVPRYGLSAFVEVPNIPTRSTYRVPMAKVYLRYSIEDPIKLHQSQTNRAKLYQEISKDLGLDRRTALAQHRFWEEVALRTARSAASGGVRGQIWALGEDKPDIAPTMRTRTPREVFDNRERWSAEVEKGARNSLEQSGLKMVACRVTEVEIPETSFNERTIVVEHEAAWLAHGVALMVEKLYSSLQPRTQQQLEQAVTTALQARGDTPLTEQQIRQIVAAAIDDAQEHLSSRILERLSRDGTLKQIESQADFNKDEVRQALLTIVREAQGTDEPRLKALIMQAIDEAADRDRIASLFERKENLR